MQGREVVITGMGVVSPVANELSLFWERIQAGTSALLASKVWMILISIPFRLAAKLKI